MTERLYDSLQRVAVGMQRLVAVLRTLTCRRCGAFADRDGVDPTLCARCEARVRNHTYAVIAGVLAVLCVAMIALNGG